MRLRGPAAQMRVTRVPSREDLAYAAGLYEGEGSFSICRPDRRYVRKDGTTSDYLTKQLSINMTDREPLERFRQTFGLPTTCLYGPYPSRSGGKDKWDLRVQSVNDIQAVLAALWLWLSPRRRQQIIDGFRAINAYYANGEDA